MEHCDMVLCLQEGPRQQGPRREKIRRYMQAANEVILMRHNPDSAYMRIMKKYRRGHCEYNKIREEGEGSTTLRMRKNKGYMECDCRGRRRTSFTLVATNQLWLLVEGSGLPTPESGELVLLIP